MVREEKKARKRKSSIRSKGGVVIKSLFLSLLLTCCCCSRRRPALPRPSGPGARVGRRGASGLREKAQERGGRRAAPKFALSSERKKMERNRLSLVGHSRRKKKTPMLARLSAASPAAEALASSSPSSSRSSRSHVGSLLPRSRDARRARGAPATYALTVPPSPSPSSPSLSKKKMPAHPFRGLPRSRQAPPRQSLTARANSNNDEDAGSSGDAEEAEGNDPGSADDSTPQPKASSSSSTSSSAAPKGGSSSSKRTPALEARKADRLRSQLLSMMPDPVDDPLFDAGEGKGEKEGFWRSVFCCC